MKNLGNRYYLMAVQYCELPSSMYYTLKQLKLPVTSLSASNLYLLQIVSIMTRITLLKWGTPVTKNVIIFLQQEALQTLTYYTFQSCSYQTPFLPYFLLQAITVPAILQIHPELFFAIPKPKIPFYYLLLTAFPIFYSQPNPNAFLTMELSQSGALPIL